MIRRALRLAVGVLVGISLVLCAIAAALWVQSYRQWYSISHDRVEDREREWVVSRWRVMLEPSCVYVERKGEQAWSKTVIWPGPMGEVRIVEQMRPAAGFQWHSDSADPRWDSGIDRKSLRWEAGRFAWAAGDTPSYYDRFRLMVIPLYSVVALAAVMPVVWMRGRLRKREAAWRVAAGMCARCGYDLRASAGRCPECGLVVGDAAGEARTPWVGGRGAWRVWLIALAWTMVAVAVQAGVMVVALWWIGPAAVTGGKGTGVLP